MLARSTSPRTRVARALWCRRPVPRSPLRCPSPAVHAGTTCGKDVTAADVCVVGGGSVSVTGMRGRVEVVGAGACMSAAQRSGNTGAAALDDVMGSSTLVLTDGHVTIGSVHVRGSACTGAHPVQTQLRVVTRLGNVSIGSLKSASVRCTSRVVRHDVRRAWW